MPSTDISDLFWLKHRAPGEALAEGVQVGSQISANFLRGVQLRQQEEQFRAEMPLKLAQVKNERDRFLVDEANRTIKEKMDLNKDAGFGALGAVVAKVGQYQDGWLNPEFGAEFWGTVSRHPQVVRDPGFKSLTDNFDIAERAALRMNEEKLKIQGRADLEGIKQTNRVELQGIRDESDLKEIGMTYDRKAELQEDSQQFRGEEGEKNRKARSEAQQKEIDAKVAIETEKAKKRLADADFRGLMGKISAVKDDPFLETDEIFKRIDAVVSEYKGSNNPAPAQSAPAPASKKRVFDPATGTFK